MNLSGRNNDHFSVFWKRADEIITVKRGWIENWGFLIYQPIIGRNSRDRRESKNMIMNDVIESMMMMTMFWAFGLATLSVLGAVRKPKFEVKTTTTTGSSINWFSLLTGDSLSINISQAYFGTGGMFQELGFNVPSSKTNDLCCLVVAKGQITNFNSKSNEVVWVMTLITQTLVGDLYDKLLSGDYIKTIPKNETIETPIDSIDGWDEFDTFCHSKKNGNISIRISHQTDKLNPSRTRYSLEDFNEKN